MAVTVDLYTDSLRTGTGSPHTFSHAGNNPEGVLVGAIHGTSSTDHISAVSYGSLALERKQRNTDTATEPGASEWWASPDGSTIPGGTQTVSITCGATTDDILFCCITLNADTQLQTIDVDGQSDTNAANPSVTLQYGGKQCMSFAAFYSGLTSHGAGVLAAGTGVTKLTADAQEIAGNFTGAFFRQTTGGTSDFTIGVTAAADDVAYSAVAIGEMAARSMSGKKTQPRAGRIQVGRRYGDATRTGNKVLAAAAGSYAVSGSTVALKFNRLVSASAGTYSLTGSSVTLKSAFKVVPASGSYALTGSDAALKFNRLIAAGAGAYSLTGTAVTLTPAYAISISAGSYSLSGSAVALKFNRLLSAGASSYAITGTSATLTYGFGVRTLGKKSQPRAGRIQTGRRYSSFSRTPVYILTAASGSYAITGTAATLSQTANKTIGKTTQPIGNEIGIGRRYSGFTRSQAFVLSAASGTYTTTGTAASLKFNRLVSAASGSYAVNGTAAAPKFNRLISATSGSYTVLGASATLSYALRIAANAGSYTLTGTSAALQYGTDKTIVAEAGSYVVTGTATGLRFASRLPVSSGAYVFTGTSLNLVSARRLAAASASYLISGTSTSLAFARRMPAQSGAYVTTGTDVTFRRGYVVSAQPGSYAFTGSSVAIQYGSNRQMVAEPGTYTVSGTAPNLAYSRRMVLDAGGYAITGSTILAAFNRRLAMNAGTYSVNGSVVGGYHGRHLSAGVGAYSLDGTALGFLVSRNLAAESGAYVVSMTSLQLIKRMVIVGETMAWPSVSADQHRWGGVDAESVL